MEKSVILICGNGGSASQESFEALGRFKKNRIPLCNKFIKLWRRNYMYSYDFGYENVFADRFQH